MYLLLAGPWGRGSKTESFGSLSWESVKNRHQRALKLHKNNESGFAYISEVSEVHIIGLCPSCHQSAQLTAHPVSLGISGSEAGVSRSLSSEGMAQPGTEAGGKGQAGRPEAPSALLASLLGVCLCEVEATGGWRA